MCPPPSRPIAHGEPGSPRRAARRVVATLAVRAPDGVDRRQVDDVEAHRGDPRQAPLRLDQRGRGRGGPGRGPGTAGRARTTPSSAPARGRRRAAARGGSGSPRFDPDGAAPPPRHRRSPAPPPGSARCGRGPRAPARRGSARASAPRARASASSRQGSPLGQLGGDRDARLQLARDRPLATSRSRPATPRSCSDAARSGPGATVPLQRSLSISRIGVSVQADASSARSRSAASSRSWPSAKMSAVTRSSSPTTRLTGCSPQSISGSTCSITIERRVPIASAPGSTAARAACAVRLRVERVVVIGLERNRTPSDGTIGGATNGTIRGSLSTKCSIALAADAPFPRRAPAGRPDAGWLQQRTDREPEPLEQRVRRRFRLRLARPGSASADRIADRHSPTASPSPRRRRRRSRPCAPRPRLSHRDHRAIDHRAR